ncbi:2-octaprenyl-6-methoxyphenyl hydroxylase [Dongshaea marina]|uniref:2-octaprenyl-6-methoxyphenyl hydroxylase n=1 Tax=Dongshaea marina TaxID=2047966 RepID=UPI00131F3343|nr:2-octaprenyl-6-methoxyphenyl hydroxylase [Dongshaea marina]
MTKPFDLVIIGGAMTGATLACALSTELARAGSVMKIAVIDSHAPQPEEHPGFDGRSVAFAAGTCQRLDHYGIWPELAAKAYPIRSIHVTDLGHAGRVLLESSEHHCDAFGQVLQLHQAGAVFNRALQSSGCELLIPRRVMQIEREAERVTLHLDNGERIQTRLLVLADGGRSPLRDQLKIPLRRIDYGQYGLTAVVEASAPVAGRAFERFTPEGPLALLPLDDSHFGVVWSVGKELRETLAGLDDRAFLSRLQQSFGFRLGRLRLKVRQSSYPLQIQLADYPLSHRVLLLGNAAHSLHPVAGQGFNLTMRDIDALTEVLVDAHNRGEDPGAFSVLNRYWQQRKSDVEQTSRLTSSLVACFSNHYWPLVCGRTLGMKGMALLPSLQRSLVRRTMGITQDR